MQGVRFPALVSTIVAPLSIPAGIYIASQAGPDYSPLKHAISDLGAVGAPTAFWANALFVAVGLCNIVTALYTPLFRFAGRVLLGFSGIATAAVAAVPVPGPDQSTPQHKVIAILAFVSMSAWPLLVMDRHSDIWTLQPRVLLSLAALALLTCGVLLGARVSELGWGGLAERAASVADVLLPTLTVHAIWLKERRPRRQ